MPGEEEEGYGDGCCDAYGTTPLKWKPCKQVRLEFRICRKNAEKPKDLKALEEECMDTTKIENAIILGRK